jgi:hypothetical protein
MMEAQIKRGKRRKLDNADILTFSYSLHCLSLSLSFALWPPFKNSRNEGSGRVNDIYKITQSKRGRVGVNLKNSKLMLGQYSLLEYCLARLVTGQNRSN